MRPAAKHCEFFSFGTERLQPGEPTLGPDVGDPVLHEGTGDGQAETCLRRPRSEEHTSELQSLMRISYAVFCLKKKKIHDTEKNKTQKTKTRSEHSNKPNCNNYTD